MSQVFKSIENYIPQRPPFELVDSIQEVEETRIRTSFFVDSNHVLCENNQLTESGLVENVAQTAAALEGYQATQKHEDVKLGFIGAVKNLEIFGFAPANTTISTEVNVIGDVIGVKIIEGKVWNGEQLLLSCNMQIFMEDTQN